MIQDIEPSSLNNEFLRGMTAKPDDSVFVFKEDKLLIGDQEGEFILPTVSQFPEKTRFQFLLRLDGKLYYLALPEKHYTEQALTENQIYTDDAKENLSQESYIEGFSYVRLHSLRYDHRGTKAEYFLSVTAYQLHRWYFNNRYCGRCGHPTRIANTERALQCPICGNRIYPKIVPAVIVGVTNGDSILLTKYANRGVGYDALVAGFTEIGETFEQTVAREVMEEAGLKVKNIRYYKSQPWGVVDDILAGFYCDVDGDTEIHRDEEELKEARWVKREDIIGQPDDMSLTNEMMMVFREGKEPK